MNIQEGFAARCVRSIEELQESGRVNVGTEDIPSVIAELADPDWVLNDIAAKTGIRLPDSPFRDYFFAPNELRVSWNTALEPYLIGEFCLTHIHRCLIQGSVDFEDVNLGESENRVLGELKVIDQEPGAGSGRLTGLRVSPEGDTHEVWLYDMSQERLERLDIDYGFYLENILVTRGAYGWQYLFADVDLNEPGLGDIKQNLTNVLNEFVELFPSQSYAHLQERLEARL